MHLEVSPSGPGPASLTPADTMEQAGEVVNEGWLIKSPPQKRFPRAVSTRLYVSRDGRLVLGYAIRADLILPDPLLSSGLSVLVPLSDHGQTGK